MRPVQPRHDSDCVAAVLASLLELPIDQVPDFWNGKGLQYERTRKWLHGRGFHYYYSAIKPRHLAALRTEKRAAGASWPPRGYWIGQISRVEWLFDGDPFHVVVMHHRRCVFNPSGTSLRQVLEPDVWLTGYYLLVPLDPAAAA